MFHTGERSDRDPGLGKRRAQRPFASCCRSPGGEHVVDEQYMACFLYEGGQLESPLDIPAAAFGPEMRLCTGAAGPLQEAGFTWRTQFAGDFLRYYSGLVVSARPAPCPMERNRHYQIDVPEELRLFQAFSQHPGEISAGLEVAFVFKGFGYLLVPALIKEEGGAIAIGLIAHVLSHILLDQGIELPGHRTLPQFPESGEREISHALGAKMLLARLQFRTAAQTDPRHEQICNGRKEFHCL